MITTDRLMAEEPTRSNRSTSAKNRAADNTKSDNYSDECIRDDYDFKQVLGTLVALFEHFEA